MALSAHIPETYINDIDQRLTVYRRLSKMEATTDLSGFKKELIDRFGTMPEAAGNLLLKIMLKILARKAGVARMDVVENHLSLQFSEGHQENPPGIVAVVTAGGEQFRMTPAHILTARLTHRGTYGHITQVKNILKDIARHVNPKAA